MFYNLNLYSTLCYILIKLEGKWIIKCNCFRFENKKIYKVCVCVCVCASLLSHIWPSAIPWTVACQAPLSMGILQGRMLEWVAMPSSRGSLPSSRGSSQPRDWTRCLTLHVDSLLSEPGKPKNTGVGSLSLLQKIFLMQGLNLGLLHCRQFLYQLT